MLPAEAGVRQGEEKKVSKAEVLVLARKYIRELEGRRRQLERENRRLVEDIGRLRGVWDGIGGGDRGSQGEIE